MTGLQIEAIMARLRAADAATQNAIAEAIRVYPEVPLSELLDPVRESPEAWASAHMEAHLLRFRAMYAEALAWFYAKERPLNALDVLIECKINLIQRGEPTTAFWKYLEALDGRQNTL